MLPTTGAVFGTTTLPCLCHSWHCRCTSEHSAGARTCGVCMFCHCMAELLGKCSAIQSSFAGHGSISGWHCMACVAHSTCCCFDHGICIASRGLERLWRQSLCCRRQQQQQGGEHALSKLAASLLSVVPAQPACLQQAHMAPWLHGAKGVRVVATAHTWRRHAAFAMHN